MLWDADGRNLVFSGRFDHAVDDKGRVSIPARFREVLQRDGHDRLYITNFIYTTERCLALYPPNQWDELIGRIKQRGAFEPKLQTFETFLVGGAHEVQVDKAGRVLIPPRLREWAGLERDVTLSARNDHFQLWDRAVLARVLKAVEEQLKDPEFFEKLNL